jgi:glycosyltransferase involved in cell wall biosynthesis
VEIGLFYKILYLTSSIASLISNGINMKIVHITSVHPWDDVRIFYRECRSLSKIGHDVYLIAQHKTKSQFRAFDVNIIGVRVPKSRFDRFLVTRRAVISQAIKLSADIYHLHDPELIPFRKKLRKTGAKVVFDMHELIDRSILNKHWIPKYFRNISYKFFKLYFNFQLRNTPTIFAEKSYQNNFSKLNETCVVQNFPNISIIPQKNNKEFGNNKVKLVYLGCISKNRGSLNMLNVAAVLQKKNVDFRLDLIGDIDESYKSELKIIIDQLELSRKIHFHGRLQPQKAWELACKSDIGFALLNPIENYVESYPTKVFEYIAMNIVPIISDFPLYKSLIRDLKCGYAISPDDSIQISNTILKINKDKDLAGKMSNLGKRMLLKKHSWSSQFEHMTRFYKQIT